MSTSGAAAAAAVAAKKGRGGDKRAAEAAGGSCVHCADGGVVTWLPKRETIQQLYEHRHVQLTVAFVIIFNFAAIVVEKEIDPYPTALQRFPRTWEYIDKACNWIFLLEIVINIYGNFWRPFVGNPWNYLDLMVVIIGIFSILNIDLGPLRQIKILRAFRILRLFKRVKSLNKILVALIKSIPGVINAFAVMLIFMMIFAIIAVDFFRDFGRNGTYRTIQTYGASDARWGQGEGMNWSPAVPFVENVTYVSSMTTRGYHYGQEYFGTFGRSLYTLFQVLTGESWSEAVVRPLLFGHDPSLSWAVGLFFTVYILITQVVLQNVVVAVLLDKFVAPEEPAEEATLPAGGSTAVAAQSERSFAARKRGPGSVAGSAGVTVLDLASLPPPAAAVESSAVSYRDMVGVRRDLERLVAEHQRLAIQMQGMLSRLPQEELAA